MPLPPLDYHRPPPVPRLTLRRLFGRIVLGAWALNAIAFVFAVANSSDRSSLQWPAAMFFGLTMIAVICLTTFHWLILVPTVWYRARRRDGGE